MDNKKFEKLNNEFASLPLSDKDNDLKKYYNKKSYINKEEKKFVHTNFIKKVAFGSVAAILLAVIIIPVSLRMFNNKKNTTTQISDNNNYQSLVISSTNTNSSLVENDKTNNANNKNCSVSQTINTKDNNSSYLDTNKSYGEIICNEIKIISNNEKGILSGSVFEYKSGNGSGLKNYTSLNKTIDYNSNTTVKYKWIENNCYISFIYNDYYYEAEINCISEININNIMEEIFLQIN